MRLIAKQGDIYVEIFRVNFYESKNVSIIGEYLLFEYLQSLIPTGVDFHSHFIYSDNGNYHFSIKYFDTEEKLYIDRKTYHNHVAIRKGEKPNFDKEIPYERRDKIPENELDMFMMTGPLKPWTENPLGHQFGVISLNSTPNQLVKMKSIDNKDFSKDDLIIDLDEFKGMNINFSVCLFSENNPSFDLSKLDKEITVIENSIKRNNLILRIYVIICKN